MASFFKNLFRKDEDSQPVPAAPLTNETPASDRPSIFQETAESSRPVTTRGRQGLPASPNGPFSAVSGRNMTAREIAALLPPSLLRFDGINPDQTVILPVAPLRESMLAGRPFIRLSQIQQACPELFQRAPLPSEDVEITFPLARVKGILDFSAPMMPPPSSSVGDAPPPGNPFEAIPSPQTAAAASPFTSGGSAPARNPFSAVTPSAAIKGGSFPASPFSTTNRPFTEQLPASPPSIPGLGPPSSPFAVAGADIVSAFAAAAKPSSSSFPSSSGPTASPFSVVAPAPPFAAAPTSGPAKFLPASAAQTPQAALFQSANPPILSPVAFVPAVAPALMQGPFAQSASAPPALLASLLPVAATTPKSSPFQSAAASPAASTPLSWPPDAASPPALPIQPRTPAIPTHHGAPIPSSAIVPVPSEDPVPRVLSPALLANTAPASEPVPALSPSPFFRVAAPAEYVPAVPPPAMIELSLRAVLRDAKAAELGFVPDNVPETVRVLLPVDSIASQLAGGRVEMGLEDICAGIPEKFRPAFARAVPGLRVIIPMSEVFHNLPESARPGLLPSVPADKHQAITTSPFQTPFAIRAEEDTSRQLLDLSVTSFDPAKTLVRPATQPVPTAILPPAPFPPVQPSVGGPPAALVELPPLRPAAGAAPESSGQLPMLPRPGVLSRAPGSATAPLASSVLAKLPPRLKTAPVSPAALRPFPKQVPPPPVASDNIYTSLPLLPFVGPPEIASLQAGDPPVSETLPVTPNSVPLPPVMFADDLGESVSLPSLHASPIQQNPAWAAPFVDSSDASIASAPAVVAEREISLPPLLQFPPAGLMDEGSSVKTEAGSPPMWPPALVPVAGFTPPEAFVSPPALMDLIKLDAVSHPPVTEPILPAVPVPPAATLPSLATSPLEDLTFGCITDLTQLTLRAVLGADQVLTPQDIVDRCGALPGLKACVLLQSGSTLTSRGMDDNDADAFRASAVKTRDSLATLAETMGLGTGGNFTLRTDHGIRSFFLESNLCLAVWHAQPQFSGGTREKLILTARELSKSHSILPL